VGFFIRNKNRLRRTADKIKQLTAQLETALNDKKVYECRTLMNEIDGACMNLRVAISALEIEQNQLLSQKLNKEFTS
jgi:hypothetical protein